MTDVLIKRGIFKPRDTDTQGERPCENGGRDWSDASTSQGAKNSQQQEAERGQEGLLASRIVREHISVV